MTYLMLIVNVQGTTEHHYFINECIAQYFYCKCKMVWKLEKSQKNSILTGINSYSIFYWYGVKWW